MGQINCKDSSLSNQCGSIQEARAKSGTSNYIDELVIIVSDCCLTPFQQFVSYIMARTS
jgi:hypothetical protein